MSDRDSHRIVVSVVSHQQAEMVALLFSDLQRYCSRHDLTVILTINREEPLPFRADRFDFPLRIVRNPVPRGFGENHNAALRSAPGDFFCVMNPDIRLLQDPFPPLCRLLSNGRSGVAAPLIVDPKGNVEDSARRFPTPLRILSRIAGIGPRLEYGIESEPFSPDWVAGMFLLFPRAVFEAMGGFDPRYFLYCEDADICTRIRLSGYDVVLDPSVRVVHDARRNSHSDPKYFAHHVRSLARFFTSKVFVAGLGVILRR